MWYRQGMEGAVVVLDVLDSWTVYRAVRSHWGEIWRSCKRERVKPCEIRERGSQRDCGKTQVKCVAQIVDRNNHGCRRYRGMGVWR